MNYFDIDSLPGKILGNHHFEYNHASLVIFSRRTMRQCQAARIARIQAPAPEVFVPAFAAWPAALRQPVGRCQERGFDDGKQRRGPLSSPYLVNVSCNDRRAEQVTGAEGYGPYRSASVEKPCRHAHAIRPRVIETGNIVEVSLDPQDDALPRHVFHAYTNRPTAGEVGEVRILPGYEIPRAGGYPHTGPAGLGIKHRAVPSIADPRGDGANLVDANRPFTRVRVWAKKLKHAKARLRLSEVAPRPGALDTENQAVPLVLAAELTAANDSLRSKLEVKNWGIRGR